MVTHSHRSGPRVGLARPAARPRRGIALVLSIVAIVVIGALIGGAFFASTQELRIGRNSLVEQRAFAAAEMGVNRALLQYGPGSGSLIPTTLATAGQQSIFNVATPAGDNATVRVTRLSNNAIWIASEGSAGQEQGGTRSVRRSNLIMNVTRPNINIGGAITTRGGAQVRGNAFISGYDTPPTGWGACAGMVPQDTAAFSVAPGKTVQISRQPQVIGDPQIIYDPNAADTATYSHYGSLTWETLKQNANIRLVPNTDPNPLPQGDAAVCNTSGSYAITNWGEPWRSGSGHVPACENYFPIIYAPGDLILNANSRGQGMLLVEGSLIVNGTFEFYGVIITKNDVKASKGNMSVHGALLSQNIDLSDNVELAGAGSIVFSNCAIRQAVNGVAVVTPVPGRSWTQMY